MTDYLTKLSLINDNSCFFSYLLYGNVIFSKKFTPFISQFYFKQGSILAFKLKRKDKGKRAYHLLYIIKTILPGTKGELIPFVSPGAKVLLKAYGLAEVNTVEAELKRVGGLSKLTEKDIKYLDNKLKSLSYKSKRKDIRC